MSNAPYEYQCPECSNIQDHSHPMNCTDAVVCSTCLVNMRKNVSLGLYTVFKESGFYENDYKNKGKKQ